MDFGILSVIIFLPMFVAFLMLILPFGAKGTRNAAFLTAVVIFMLVSVVYYNFELYGFMQFSEHYEWISTYGINYSIGIDGFSLIILMLIAILIPCAYLWLWDGRTKGYWVSMLLIQTGITGTLFSQDLILFYFFWEAMLLPVFMIIGMFGTGNRVFSTIKITVYTMMGSLFMLISILYLGVAFFENYGFWSFALSDIIQIQNLSKTEEIWLFVGFMIAFAIKIPLFPFHTWLLETYSNSPTGGVFLLSSIMAKLGVYGIVRFVMPIFPELYKEFAPYFVWIGIFGLIYFGIAALMQTNIKKMFAYSSASHLGFIVTGIFSLNAYGMTGAAFLIIAHAMATGGLFLLVGKMEYNLGTKSIPDLGGIAKKAPMFTTFFAIMVLCIVGLPGTNGFVSEFLIILGAFGFSPSAGIVSAFTVLIAASFMFWMFQKAILVDSGNDTSKMKDLNLKETMGMIPLAFLIIAMGIYPDWFFYKIEPTIQHYIVDILEIRNY
ncbi:MAG: NADH-quinone oxidoreductase subunit M [Sulfurospirillum sp.]|nr:NADH-quinone oxidoreductase subunit M [Sulfurospirillum sp.]MBL0702599.1 NADH-quinone oxidoreductase subunit M [Sulfurospirillum sp.]